MLSRITETMTRVPRMQALPWQMAGFTLTRSLQLSIHLQFYSVAPARDAPRHRSPASRPASGGPVENGAVGWSVLFAFSGTNLRIPSKLQPDERFARFAST